MCIVNVCVSRVCVCVCMCVHVYVHVCMCMCDCVLGVCVHMCVQMRCKEGKHTNEHIRP